MNSIQDDCYLVRGDRLAVKGTIKLDIGYVGHSFCLGMVGFQVVIKLPNR